MICLTYPPVSIVILNMVCVVASLRAGTHKTRVSGNGHIVIIVDPTVTKFNSQRLRSRIITNGMEI